MTRPAVRTETMTGRQRILATFAQDPVDRFPVWLKMANRTWQNPQPKPYRSMDAWDLLEACGCDLISHTHVPVHQEQPHVTVQTRRDGDREYTFWQTPDGELRAERHFDPYTQSWHPCVFPADSSENLRRLRWLFKDTRYHADEAESRKARAWQEALEARGGVSGQGVGPGPLMNLVEHQAGPVQIAYLLADVPELVDEVMAEMHADRLRYLSALLPATPTETIWLTENTSTTLISPDWFQRYCAGHLREYGQRIADAGKIGVHHMCGTLNALLEKIDPLPCTVNEAYTTRPLGDVSLAEGRARMPSKALMGGTNATLWLEEPETIAATVAEDLANCPDRRGIFLTSAGVLPAPVSFDKARRTVALLKELPVD